MKFLQPLSAGYTFIHVRDRLTLPLRHVLFPAIRQYLGPCGEGTTRWCAETCSRLGRLQALCARIRVPNSPKPQDHDDAMEMAVLGRVDGR